MPWLNITRTNCNCNNYPTRGLILQNTSSESQYLHNINDGDIFHNDCGISDNDSAHSGNDGETDDEHVTDHNDDSVSDNEQVNTEQLDNIVIPENKAVQSCAVYEQQYTETFKLKGTSFHAHFQSALRSFKLCQLSKVELPELSLHFEPMNKQDENAIVVVTKIDGTTDPIGYIPGSKVEKITKAHYSHEITNVQISEIKREFNVHVGGFVYAAFVSITKKGGRWPPNSNKYCYNCKF